jgi:alkylation response protein AidB-like acyl-CoA dehydrogenase
VSIGAPAEAPLDELADSDVAQRVRELAPWLSRRADAIERAGEVPADVVTALRDAGCLRLVVPARHGGADLSLSQVVTVVEAVTRASGTLGWLVGQVALAHAVISYLPVETIAAIYDGGPDVFAAGAAAAKGRAVWTGEAWQVSGRWPLVSGIAHAEWLYLQCVVAREGEPWAAQDVAPDLRTVVVPASRVRVIPTWHGLGLRGSGSHDAHLSVELCPPELTCDLLGPPAVVTASGRIPVRTQAGLVAAAFMTGTAGAALDAIAALASQKRPSFSTRRLAESPRFQRALGDAYATLCAARSLLATHLAAAEPGAAGGGPVGAEEETLLRAVGPKVAELAGSVIDVAYALGGSSSVSDASPLQSRLRDGRSISQHATLSAGYYGALGALAAGAEPAV